MYQDAVQLNRGGRSVLSKETACAKALGMAESLVSKRQKDSVVATETVSGI